MQKFNNIFIFNLDDALLCTSVLTSSGCFKNNMVILPEKLEKIKELKVLLKKILTMTLNNGDKWIIILLKKKEINSGLKVIFLIIVNIKRINKNKFKLTLN